MELSDLVNSELISLELLPEGVKEGRRYSLCGSPILSPEPFPLSNEERNCWV